MKRSFEYKDILFEFDYIDKELEFHKKFNLEYHSLFLNKEVVLDEENNSFFNKGFQKFLDELEKNAEINFAKKTIFIAYFISLKNL